MKSTVISLKYNVQVYKRFSLIATVFKHQLYCAPSQSAYITAITNDVTVILLESADVFMNREICIILTLLLSLYHLQINFLSNYPILYVCVSVCIC